MSEEIFPKTKELLENWKKESAVDPSGYPSRWPKSPRQRYMEDATFKAMVDMMTAHMMNCDYTPSEMREAALLASIRYYEMRPQGLVVRADQLHELMRKLEEG